MLTLMLTFSLAATPDASLWKSYASSPRSVRLVEAELRQLERKLVSAERMLPAVPVLAGALVVGGAATAIGIFMIAGSGLNLATAALALLLVVGGPLVVIAGVITAIAFAVQNSNARAARVYALRDALREKQSELEVLRGERGVELAPPLLTF